MLNLLQQQDKFTLQWHITDLCDRKCAHCYGQNSFIGLERNKLQYILQQLIQFVAHFKIKKCRIHITGGDPFLHPDLFYLLEAIVSYRRQCTFTLLTHGGYLDEQNCRRLAKLPPEWIQLSVDGLAPRHDQWRGQGDFARVVATIERLHAHGLPVVLSYTVHRDNQDDFVHVARLARKWRVKALWSDRLLPLGRGEQMREQIVTPQAYRQFLHSMAAVRKEWSRWPTPVVMNRALQFLLHPSHPYHCHAGDNLLALLPDATLLPCRRLPRPLGNLLTESMIKIYESHPFLQALRHAESTVKGCERCPWQRSCRGGLKCMSYALYGDPLCKDPGCWL